jgi:hypothetical protein
MVWVSRPRRELDEIPSCAQNKTAVLDVSRAHIAQDSCPEF